jgi:hypothetical protein
MPRTPGSLRQRGTRPGGDFLGTLGRFIVRNPWKVVGAWIIVAIAVIATAPALPATTNESSFLPGSYESIRAQALEAQAFPQASRWARYRRARVLARRDLNR